jgi:hypothetical protein
VGYSNLLVMTDEDGLTGMPDFSTLRENIKRRAA